MMARTRTSRRSRSARLLDALSKYERILAVMHDNPDPDAIASGWGVQVMIRERLGKPVRIVGGGAIVRAENRHMVGLLRPPIELVDGVSVDDATATILVDCGAESTNHLLTRQGIEPIAVIDHHANETPSVRAPYQDIRPGVAASATIVASYFQEQQLEPAAKLATAMWYAIRTETCGHETHYSALDRAILPWLSERGEPAILAEIENAPLARDYFGDLLLALQSTFIYEGAALCFLPRAAGAEIVGEVADMLIRCEDIDRVLCGAIVGEDLLLSARTQRGFGSAVNLLSKTLDGLGGAGGHAHRAGGKIPGVGRGAKIAEDLHDKLRSRWLAACGTVRKRGTRLVAKREIAEHLES
jgi:nanoRNase/pAp phosphatase (c-di-AMP/oligoRNAs hydrolase)